MPDMIQVKPSCYWPFPWKAIAGDGARVRVYNENASRILLDVEVSPDTVNGAQCEASARLKLSEAFGPDAGTVGISYWGGKWRLLPYAPFGVGDRGNALVPGRDFASGGQGVEHWPFATQIIIRNRPAALEDEIRPQLYHADDFGDAVGALKKWRLDLFTATPCNFFSFIDIEVRKPWAGSVAASWVIDRDPTKGFQQCANKIGFPGKDGKPLVEDGIWGANTEAAMFQFLAEHDGRFLYGLPDYIKERPRPWDPEIYFHVREAAREVCE